MKAHRPIGLIDADLLCKGTRHPNLVLLKLAGFIRDRRKSYTCELICNPDADLNDYSRVYLSRVFSFTELPRFVREYQAKHADWRKRLLMGGTGFYATEPDVEKFRAARDADMRRLENDAFLEGLDMAHQMPDYTLYESLSATRSPKGHVRTSCRTIC